MLPTLYQRQVGISLSLIKRLPMGKIIQPLSKSRFAKRLSSEDQINLRRHHEIHDAYDSQRLSRQ